jgi:hypothetical protein
MAKHEPLNSAVWQVITASEVTRHYGVSRQAVCDACLRGWVTARKSGKTWLIDRKEAERRWSGKE